MAEINVKFDSREKTLEATIDGQKMENVDEVFFFKNFDSEDFSGSLLSRKHDKESGMTFVERISANKDGNLIVQREDTQIDPINAMLKHPAFQPW